MGASAWRTFWTVVIPIARPIIVAGLLFVFVFTLGSYIIAFFLGRPEHWTLSVFIADQASAQANVPFASAMAIFLTLLIPAMITGYAAAFVLSLNEYIISFLVAGFTVETLPVKIVNGLRYGFTPTIAAVAVVFIVIAATTLTLFAIFGNLMRFLGADPEILEKNG
jgi:ABC-type spermidine/putrescine transport system permease subunit II